MHACVYQHTYDVHEQDQLTKIAIVPASDDEHELRTRTQETDNTAARHKEQEGRISPRTIPLIVPPQFPSFLSTHVEQAEEVRGVESLCRRFLERCGSYRRRDLRVCWSARKEADTWEAC